MQRAGTLYTVAVGIVVAAGLAAPAQTPPPAAAAPVAQSAQAQASGSAQASSPAAANAAVTGGRLHGVVKSGVISLPGVAVTAQNTLTGKRYSTTSDITGAWSMNIPQNGRYVIRTQFSAFAQGSQEAVLNAANHDATANFELILASRAAAQEQQTAQGGTQGSAEQAIRQLAGNGAENLSLMSALSADTETGSGTAGAGGAELPTIANNSDFGGDSVAISGQSGQVSPLAGVDMDRLRDAMETMRAQNGGQGQPGSDTVGLFGGGGGGLFGGGGFGGPGGGFGGPGGFGGGGFGGRGGGGGRGNFRGFNPGQPHGAFFWIGSNSAINAEPFALRGQTDQFQPASGSNRFGITFMSAPYIPGLTKPSGKDTIFLSLSGTRTSNPLDEYATVPTAAERTGDFSAAGLPAIYNPATGQQFTNNGVDNVIPSTDIASQATALLGYFPSPNLPGTTQNYHLLSTQQSNTTQAGLRYNRSLGKNATQPGGGGRGGFGGGRRSQNQGLRQSINFNYNWAHSAADSVNIFPQLGGKTASDSYSLQAGYTVGYHRVTSIFNASWNRSNSQTTNFFTNTTDDVASDLGIPVPNDDALNHGLPSVTLSNITGLSETQPSFSLAQTITLSETLSWIHGKHNLRFGGDYRRVHRDFLAGSNATGNFTFTGLFTENDGDQTTGSPIADFLLGLPQSTSLDSSLAKSYLRDNVVDGYTQDDWRALPSLTVMYGLRYEFFAPYTEKYDRLAEVVTNPAGGFTTQTEAQAGTAGLPGSLVYPDRKAFAPRLGLAWRVPKIKQTVVRAGYGMNYVTGAYSSFATAMAHEPPFANEQTNEEADANGNPTTACVQTGTCFSLANGFPAPASTGNYALDPHYRLPYVQAWNLDIQKTLPWGIVMNLGYNGSRSNRQDISIAPRATALNPDTDPSNLVFKYEEPVAFSKFHAGTVRVNKRLTGGIALGANYQYSHLIDDAGALGSTAAVSVQNWQDITGEESNSNLDVRHKVSGTYLYELPFGKDKYWLTTGLASHILEGFSASGTFTFATGTPLSPTYTAAVLSVACGTAGTFRPDRVPGVSLTAGGGSQERWFNPAAFSEPVSNATYPCGVFGTSPRNPIEGPGTVQNNLSLSKTASFGDTRSLEIRATLNNAFNTVQYSGVDTNVASPSFGQVISVGTMRAFQFTSRFRF